MLWSTCGNGADGFAAVCAASSVSTGLAYQQPGQYTVDVLSWVLSAPRERIQVHSLRKAAPLILLDPVSLGNYSAKHL